MFDFQMLIGLPCEHKAEADENDDRSDDEDRKWADQTEDRRLPLMRALQLPSSYRVRSPQPAAAETPGLFTKVHRNLRLLLTIPGTTWPRRLTQDGEEAVNAGQKRKRYRPLAENLFEAKPKRGNAQKRKEPNNICHGRHERSRRYRRVNTKADQPQRNQDSSKRRSSQHGQHRQSHDQAQITDVEPRSGDHSHNQREAKPVENADQQFTSDNAPCVCTR